MSASSEKFCVFVSFRGEDTRRTFVSHLRCSLNQRGITTLEDGNELRGEEWDPSMFDRSIGRSKVAVVLISENYVSSPWCLENLVKILGFHQSGSLAVIPVFYEIGYCDVIEQTGKLLKPFSLHERQNPMIVQTWRRALSQLADISTCLYSDNWQGDAEMIGKITEDIWGMMIGSKSSDLCGLVGMDRHMKAIYRLLSLETKDDQVRWIEIWGQQGLGKTKLAKYLYEEVFHYFEIHIWLDIPRKNRSRAHDYDKEYRKELTQKLSDKLWRFRYTDHRRPRALIVLDNVTERHQCHLLEREFELLGPGSIVIITSEKKGFAEYIFSHSVFSYKVVGLEFSEALQLFCLYAFEQSHPLHGFEELSCRALRLTNGCPPTLKTLASALSGKHSYEWEVILSGYERSSSSSNRGIIYSHDIYLPEDSSFTATVPTQSRKKSNSNRLIGMDRHMQALNRLLEVESDHTVRVVNIWGNGGVGKTTLAKYAYEGISHLFHSHVFLENVEENSSSLCLEDQFLSKAIERDAYTIRNSKDGSDVVKLGLRRQKVLLVVDGVYSDKELKDVLKISSWFGPGSRVIVTTRDETLLLANGVKHLYEVKCLRFDEALQLFYQFAFKNTLPSVRFRQLSVRAIKLVGFLPLALKVTGSILYCRPENFWETILQSFEEKQDKENVELSIE